MTIAGFFTPPAVLIWAGPSNPEAAVSDVPPRFFVDRSMSRFSSVRRTIWLLAALVASGSPSLASAAEGPPLEIIPDQIDTLVVLDLTGVYDSPAAKALLKKHPELSAALDTPVGPRRRLKPRMCNAIYVAMDMAAGEGILATRVDIELKTAEIVTEDSAVEKVGDFVILPLQDKLAGTVIGKHTIVAGASETLRKVLRRNGPAKLPAEISAILRDIPQDCDGFAVALSKSAAELVGASFSLSDVFEELSPKIKWAAATVDAGDRISTRAKIACADAETARRLHDVIVAEARSRAADPLTSSPWAASLATLRASVEESIVVIQIELDAEALYPLNITVY
jgi:hypothetical protein